MSQHTLTIKLQVRMAFRPCAPHSVVTPPALIDLVWELVLNRVYADSAVSPYAERVGNATSWQYIASVSSCLNMFVSRLSRFVFLVDQHTLTVKLQVRMAFRRCVPHSVVTPPTHLDLVRACVLESII